MSASENKFNVSQEFEIIPLQKSKAYPIGVNEWDFIKAKINGIKIEINNFHSIGFLLLGTSLSCFITIIVTEFTDKNDEYLVRMVFGITLLSGFLSVCFSNDKNKHENAKPKEIIDHMQLIETRFKSMGE